MLVAAKLVALRVAVPMLHFPPLPHGSKAAFPCSNVVAAGMAALTGLEPLSLSPPLRAARVQSELSSLSPAVQDVTPEPGAVRSREHAA